MESPELNIEDLAWYRCIAAWHQTKPGSDEDFTKDEVSNGHA